MIFQMLFNQAFEAGRIRIVRKPDSSYSMQVRVFGAWFGIANIKEYEVKENERL
jgi:hypothetical protein